MRVFEGTPTTGGTTGGNVGPDQFNCPCCGMYLAYCVCWGNVWTNPDGTQGSERCSPEKHGRKGYGPSAVARTIDVGPVTVGPVEESPDSTTDAEASERDK